MQRQRINELMDDPSLHEHEHLHARSGLRRINEFIGSARLLWRQIKPLAIANGGRPLRIMDVATGSADVPLRLWQIARSEGFELQIDGCDLSECGLSRARENAQAVGAPSNFFRLNVVTDKLPQDYDVFTTSLFVHHLSEEDTVRLLSNMRQATRKMVILVDLTRSEFNHKLIWLATRLLSTSKVVHFDGPASVLNAYTVDEMRSMAERAGYDNACVREVMPARMMLTWAKE